MIRKRNLDPSLISWIQNTVGIGFVGEVYHVAKTDSNYYQKLLDDGNVAEANIFSLPSAAILAATADRGDTVIIHPGSYNETSEVAWNKDHINLIASGSAREWNDYSEALTTINCTTAAVAETIDLTGDHCFFQGINFTNKAANTGNLSSFNVDGYAATFKGCSFDAAMDTTADVAAAAALYIDSLGCQALFEDCRIGDSSWWTRDQANSGQLAYVGTNTYETVFRRCLFTVSSETADVALVRIATANSCQKHHIFDTCYFINQSVNWANTLNRVFYVTTSPVTAQFLIHNCISVGFTEYQSDDTGWLFSTANPAGNAGGCIGVEATG